MSPENPRTPNSLRVLFEIFQLLAQSIDVDKKAVSEYTILNYTSISFEFLENQQFREFLTLQPILYLILGPVEN